MTTADREKFDKAMFDIMSLSQLLKLAGHGLQSDFCEESNDEIAIAFGAAVRIIEEKAETAHSLVADAS